MNPLDSLIAAVAPVWGRKRAIARYQLQTLKRAMDAGVWDRTSGRAKPAAQGPVERSRTTIENVRLQARDLYRSNNYVSGMVDGLVADLVGKGVKPLPDVRMVNGKRQKGANKTLTDSWKRWADSASMSGRESIYDLQRLIVRERIVAGESLIHVRVPLDSREIPLAVEVIPSERLAHDKDEEIKDSEGRVLGEIVQGVQFDNQGLITAYWIYPNHPHDFRTLSSALISSDPVAVPSQNIWHVFDRKEPGQVRGNSQIATIAPLMESLSQYLNHELTKAAVASAFAVAITQDYDGFNLPDKGESSTDDFGNETGFVDPGMILKLRRGEDAKVINPSIQSDAFDPFVTLILRGASVGFGTSYENASGDLSKVTYLSARQGENRQRRLWEPVQECFDHQALSPIYRAFVEAAVIAGVLETQIPAGMPARERQQVMRRFSTVRHVFPGRPWIDPEKDVEANIKAIRAGLRSPIDAVQESGQDPERVLEDNRKFREAAAEKSVPLPELEDETDVTQETNSQTDSNKAATQAATTAS